MQKWGVGWVSIQSIAWAPLHLRMEFLVGELLLLMITASLSLHFKSSSISASFVMPLCVQESRYKSGNTNGSRAGPAVGSSAMPGRDVAPAVRMHTSRGCRVVSVPAALSWVVQRSATTNRRAIVNHNCCGRLACICRSQQNFRGFRKLLACSDGSAAPSPHGRSCGDVCHPVMEPASWRTLTRPSATVDE